MANVCPDLFALSRDGRTDKVAYWAPCRSQNVRSIGEVGSITALAHFLPVASQAGQKGGVIIFDNHR